MIAHEASIVMEAAPYAATSVATLLGGTAMGIFFTKKRNEFFKRKAELQEDDIVYAYDLLLGAKVREAAAIKAQREAEEQAAAAKEQAAKDELTGLSRRLPFIDAVEKHKAYLTRHQGLKAGAIMMLDIDHFKQINDQEGHAKGDDVLKTVGRLLTDDGFLRAEDTAARWGGEEFAVLALDTGEEGAVVLANRLREAFHENSGRTVSIGLSVFDPDISTADQMARADAALYHAKENGRDQVVVYNESIPLMSDPKTSS